MIYRYKHTQKDRHTHIHKQTDIQTYKHTYNKHSQIHRDRGRETERHTHNRQTDILTQRQTDR